MIVAPQVGQLAPNFTLNDTNGNAVTLSEVAKDQVVHLVFNRGFI